MEVAVVTLFVGFGLGWVLGYYNIPNIKLSSQDALDDLQEPEALREYRHPEITAHIIRGEENAFATKESEVSGN